MNKYKNIFFLISLLIFLLVFSYVFSQKQSLDLEGYFSVKKTSQGFFIGAEIIDLKTKTAISGDYLYNYFWTLPLLFFKELASADNFIFYPITDYNILSSDNLTVELKMVKFLQASQNFTFRKKIIFEKPIVQIVKISNNIYVPVNAIDATIDSNDILTVLVKNFSNNAVLNYSWELNNINISQNRDLPAYLIINNLKNFPNIKSVNIKVKVVSNNKIESASDSKQIKIR